jgi:hypothetical protein
MASYFSVLYCSDGCPSTYHAARSVELLTVLDYHPYCALQFYIWDRPNEVLARHLALLQVGVCRVASNTSCS